MFVPENCVGARESCQRGIALHNFLASGMNPQIKYLFQVRFDSAQKLRNSRDPE